MTDLLPIAGVAAIAFYLANAHSGDDNKPKTNNNVNQTESERMRDQHLQDMRAYGASASFYKAEHNKIMLNHANKGKELSLVFPEEARTVEHMFQQHADIAHYDSQESMMSVHLNQGELRMSRRNPVIQTLSHEVSNNGDPSMSQTFDYYYENVPYANQAQVRQTKAIVEADMAANPDNAQRRYYGTELFNRAYGQSFRYSEG